MLPVRQDGLPARRGPRDEVEVEGLGPQHEAPVEARLDAQVQGPRGREVEGPEQLRQEHQGAVLRELVARALPAAGAEAVGGLAALRPRLRGAEARPVRVGQVPLRPEGLGQSKYSGSL